MQNRGSRKLGPDLGRFLSVVDLDFPAVTQRKLIKDQHFWGLFGPVILVTTPMKRCYALFVSHKRRNILECEYANSFENQQAISSNKANASIQNAQLNNENSIKLHIYVQ